jgi:glycosyltransferase involved in cell wall biosynthesis
VVIVDDGNQDDTETVLRTLEAKHAWVRPIRLARNFGQHNALLCGIRAAAFSLCATIDDDAQTPPEELPKLFRALGGDLDVIYGTPAEAHYRFFRRFATAATKWALRVAMRDDIAWRISAFRLFRTSLRDAFTHFDNPYVSVDVLLSWGTRRFGFVEVRHDPRTQGQSHYTLLKLISYTLSVLFGFSTLPLRLVAGMGMVLSGFGVLVLIYVIGRYFMLGGSVPGFPFIASIISIFSGTQLFALGIVGEYLTRIYLRSLGQPAYVVRADSGTSPRA